MFFNCYLMRKILINAIHNLDLLIMLPYFGKRLPQTGTKANYVIKKSLNTIFKMYSRLSAS